MQRSKNAFGERSNKKAKSVLRLHAYLAFLLLLI
jgi:hypothetical protein